MTGCGVITEGPAKKTPANLIATPASYYSTAKARYLGNKYKDNLDRLTEKIVRNPGTMQLQFANNISSVGGIGFFTHSATKTADERYLEVVLATPETFDYKGDYSEKVNCSLGMGRICFRYCSETAKSSRIKNWRAMDSICTGVPWGLMGRPAGSA